LNDGVLGFWGFGVIANIDLADASELAQSIRATLSYPISLANEQVKVDVSIGYAPIDLANDATESLRRADLAMYEAKRSRSGALLWKSGQKK